MANTQMKKNHRGILQKYLAALRGHLGTRRRSGAASARALGREAMAAGLSALDLARMHEESLAALAASRDFANTRDRLILRERRFLAEVLVPAERVQRATQASVQQLQQREEVLRLHTAAMAKGNRQLQREIERRKAGEAALKKSKEHYQRLFVQSKLNEEKLRHLARQVLIAQEQERQMVSRELHDTVVQTLVGINVRLTALGQAASLGPRAIRSKIAQMRRLVEKSVSAVHQFARELRPAVLDDLGLIPALHAYMKILAARHTLKINLTAFAGVELLDNTKRTVLYRVAQEALINIGRHAEASTVDVSINQVGDVVRMEVHDNGKSFDVARTLSAPANRRLGVLGMRERVEMLGGHFDIESRPGWGTTVRAEIPFRTGGSA